MNPFHIDIHEISTQGVYIHRIEIPDLNELQKTAENINILLEACRDYVDSLNEKQLMNLRRKFIFATASHREAFLIVKIINHSSPKEFFSEIAFNVNAPNIKKTLTKL